MTNYTIIGGGRLARHFAEYFRLRNISFNQWQRPSAGNPPAQQDSLSSLLEASSHVLLLISDTAIPGFVATHPELREKTLIHCSGAHSFPGIAGVHPLMTFADELYCLQTYESIPMICEASKQAGFEFKQLFPQLHNSYYSLDKDKKALYHAYCVAAGNFSQMLWQMSAEGMQEKLALPSNILHSYLQQNLSNFIKQGASALTGPIVRGDRQTVQNNIKALENQPLAAIYREFYRSTQQVGQSKHNPGHKKERAA